jgi:hypothetical protein
MNTNSKDIELRQSFIMGLTAFTENSFPKKCEQCSKIYVTRKDLLRETSSGFNGHTNASNEAHDIDMGSNCSCGSKLVSVPIAFRTSFTTERSRREKFGVMLESLVKHGIEVKTARAELIMLLSGKPSKLIQDFAKNLE